MDNIYDCFAHSEDIAERPEIKEVYSKRFDSPYTLSALIKRATDACHSFVDAVRERYSRNP